MLHELRFYEIAAGRVADYINHAGAVAVPFRGDRYGKLLGFWSCIFRRIRKPSRLPQRCKLPDGTHSSRSMVRWWKTLSPA